MCMTRHEARVLSSLLSGTTFNGEFAARVEQMSPRFRCLAERLNETELDARRDVFYEFLRTRDDREAVIEAVENADPTQLDDPPADDDPADDWPPPRLRSVPAVEPFPLSVLPDSVRKYAEAVAAAIGCPIDFVCLSIIITIGAAIGRSASLQLKPGYSVTPALYGVNVGAPTAGKSPAMRAVVDPMRDIDRRLHDEYRTEKEAFDAATRQVTKGEAEPKSPPKPVIKSAVISDSTTEAVARHLQLNPRGLFAVYDEGMSWLNSFDAYRSGKGGDRQFYLSALNGEPIRVDRKGNPDGEPLRVSHPFLAIVANVTPDLLASFREARERADGFVERILFVFPDPVPKRPWNEVGIPEELQSCWNALIKRLYARPMLPGTEGCEVPATVKMTPEAKTEWISWFNEVVDESNSPDYDALDASADGKLEAYAGRFVLILHLLRLETDPSHAFVGTAIPDVDVTTVRDAIKLWSYFRSHGRRARCVMCGGADNPDARRVVDWLVDSEREHFTVKQLTDNFRWFSDRENGHREALKWLESRDVIKAIDPPERQKGMPGRKPSPAYLVNPHLIGRSQNSRNTQNSDRTGI